MTESLSVVGKAVIPDLSAKARGTAVYTSDMKLPGMLCGKILRSKLAHARILNIDVNRVKRLPGVKAIITGKEAPANLWGIMIKDKPAFATDKVCFIGDEIAGVVATDEDIADEALELIDVEYEEIPAILDPMEAMKKSAPLIHEKLGEYEVITPILPIANSNINSYRKLRQGNVGEGFEQADYVFEDEYKVPSIHTCAFEPMVCIAQADAGGNITIWSSTQAPYEVRDTIAEYLRVPFNKVRVIAPLLGGGFGGKLHMKGELACAIMSQVVERPVKLDFSREEVFVGGGRRPSLITRIKTGMKKNGDIIARHCWNVWDSGAYADMSPRIALRGMQNGGGAYKISNIWVDSHCVYTNNPISTAYRGYGTNHMTWAVEAHTDSIAEKLNIDPVGFRLQNALDEGDIAPTGQVLHAVGLKECLRSLKEKGKRVSTRNKKPFTGVGIACFHKPTNTPTAGGAFVKLNQDGTADLLMSAVDMGQGSNTTLAQMVAEELGIPVGKVRVSLPDTAMTPYYSGTAGSRTNFVIGNAVKRATASVRNQLLKLASVVLDVNVERLELKDGKISIKGSAEGIELNKLPIGGGKFASGVGHPVIGEGYYSSAGPGTIPDPETGQAERTAVFWSYGANLVEIEVDPDTGMIRINRIISAHNVGKVLNPFLIERQCEGGLVMAIGEALYEKMIFEDGVTMNPNFRDYKLPTFSETPGKIEYIFVEIPHREAPYGNVGIGEMPTIATPAAVTNAVYDAIGVRFKELPLTPEVILKALKDKKEEAMPLNRNEA